MAGYFSVCRCGDADCPGPCDERVETVMGACRICGQDFEVREGMPDGATFCGSYDCRVASGIWPGASEADRAAAWHAIFRAAVGREHRPFSPTNIRAILKDCRADLARPATPNLRAARARETADWYARLFVAEDAPSLGVAHA